MDLKIHTAFGNGAARRDSGLVKACKTLGEFVGNFLNN